MKIEYEATFTEVDHAELRSKLRSVGAALLKPEFLQRRSVFHLPKSNEIPGGWLRVRDEGDRVTMSLKVVDGASIHDQKEACLIVHSFEEAAVILEAIGCRPKAYQETRRELWSVYGVEVALDEWPFLEPFVEVEGENEASVKAVAEELGFVWAQAKFCHVGTLYSDKYGFPEAVFNNETPRLTFDMRNPFTGPEKAASV